MTIYKGKVWTRDYYRNKKKKNMEKLYSIGHLIEILFKQLRLMLNVIRYFLDI